MMRNHQNSNGSFLCSLHSFLWSHCDNLRMRRSFSEMDFNHETFMLWLFFLPNSRRNCPAVLLLDDFIATYAYSIMKVLITHAVL